MRKHVFTPPLGLLFSCLFLCLPPVRLFSQTPAGIQKIIKNAGSAADYPGAASVVLLDRTCVSVEDSGRSTERRTVLRKILTQKGVLKNSVVRFSYDPLTSRIDVKRVRIFRSDGSVCEAAPQEAVDVPQPAGIIFWGARMKLLSLPQLAAGDAIEIKTEKTGFNIAYLEGDGGDGDAKYIPPMRGTFNDVIRFMGGVPVQEKSYTLNMPRNKPIQCRLYNGRAASSITFEGDRVLYTWTMKEIDALKKEPHMVSSSDVAPKLVISTLNNWRERSRWFYKINEPQLKADGAIREKVDELLEGIITDEEKIAVLTHWVAENVRYVGLSMGKGEGYTVHKAAVTFRDRGGVCKDKAALLVSMLREAGIESYIVMTEAGARVETIPADQFNHCVACVREKDKSLRLLDPTWAPNSRELWSSQEALQHVVFGVPEGRDLALSPYVPPEENYLRIKSRTKLSRTGGISAVVTVECDGAPDTQLRRMIEGTPVAKRRELFAAVIARIAPNAALLDLSFSDPNDFSKPLTIAMEYKADEYAIRSGRRMLLTPPLSKHLFASSGISGYLYRTGPGRRTWPFEIRATRSVLFTEELVLPEGYSLQNGPEDKTITGRASDFSFSLSGENNVVTATEKIVFKHRINAAETYQNFKRVVSAVKDLYKARIVVSCTSQKLKL